MKKLKSLRRKILEPVAVVYKPTFDIPEQNTPDISNKKIGERVKLLVNFEVVEKTKSYTILRTSGITLMTKKRAF